MNIRGRRNIRSRRIPTPDPNLMSKPGSPSRRHLAGVLPPVLPPGPPDHQTATILLLLQGVPGVPRGQQVLTQRQGAGAPLPQEHEALEGGDQAGQPDRVSLRHCQVEGGGEEGGGQQGGGGLGKGGLTGRMRPGGGVSRGAESKVGGRRPWGRGRSRIRYVNSKGSDIVGSNM